ncbi:MAG: DNA polymerase III subunit delta [Planctomycetota bacterium]
MAVPNPERELTRLRTLVGRGLPPVVLVTGAADFFRSEAMDLALAALPEDADIRTLAGEQDTDGAELDVLRGGSLFGEGAWLVVRRAEGWLKKHGAALAAVLPGLRPGCGAIVEATKLDRRTKAGKALAKGAAVFEFRALYTEPYDRTRSPLDAEMVDWLVQRARGVDLRLTREAALLLMHTVGTDPAECLAELQRLATRAGGEAGNKGSLGPDDLRGLLSCGFESTPFELADALLERDRQRTERSLEAMLQRGVRGRDGDRVDTGGVFPFVTSWLYQALARCYEGRFLLDRGVPLREVGGRVGVRAFADRFLQQVRLNPEPRLRRGLLLLHEAQRELRQSGESPGWVLRRFLLRYFAEDAA